MRPCLPFLLAAALLAACGESQAPALSAEYPAKRIGERVYVIHGPNELPNKANQGFMNNPGFVITSKGVVVVDPGSSVQVGEMVLRAVAAVTREPVIAVFNTHIHGDHWLGNQAIKAAYPQAVIYAHPKMKARAPVEGPAWVERLERLTGGATRGTRAVVPDTVLDNDETLRLGDRRFRIYHHGHAHTDGDLMIEVIEDKVMFTGDNVMAERVGRMDDGHFAGSIAAIDMALASGAEHFVPGHGPSNGRATLRAYQDYLKTVYAGVKKYHDLDPTDPEIKARILPSLERFRGWREFDSEVGRHVGQIVQEIEAASF
jgi:glyoxylase-like metal-dependent hydrolase (beta-lactamase superfamily II)